MFWLRKFVCLSKTSQEEWVKLIRSVKSSNYENVIISYLQWKLKEKVVEADLPCCWFKKFRCFSMENQKDWIKVIESEKNFEKGIAIMSYLQWELKKEDLVDLPCYSSPAIQKDFRERIWQKCKKSRWELSDEDTEIVKILAPLTDNPNAQNKHGSTPIHEAASKGYTEIVKILAPLTDNPNAPDYNAQTPIYRASFNCYTEIVKILAALTDNPNASDPYGTTPIQVAANYGHTEIVKMLDQFDRKC